MSVSEADRHVLEKLASHGDNPAISRPVMHFFYGDFDELSKLNQRLGFPDWTEAELAKGPEDYRLVATKVTDLIDQSIELMMDEVNRAIAGLDLEYDGWETSVEKAN